MKDVRRLRYFSRPLVYLSEQWEFYRLQETRAKMMMHKVVDKSKLHDKPEEKDKGEFVWVLHVKPVKTTKYGMFWRPGKRKDQEKKEK